MAERHGDKREPSIFTWRLALCIVVLAALALRLFGLDWDDGADLHPDELFVAKIVLIDRIHLDLPPDLGELLDPARSGLNPRSVDPATGQYREFAYGALPLWITDATAALLTRVSGTNWNAMDHAYLVGRTLSALLSAFTIVPIAFTGVLLGGRTVGLLAALFAALAPMSVQLAHFFTTDSWLTLFVALALLACVLAAQQGTALRFAAAGAAIGLAMATKGSVFTLAAPLAVALAIDAVRAWPGDSLRGVVRSAVQNGSAAVGAAALAFLAFEPYALLQPGVYLQSLRTQAEIVSGAFDVPFSRVYVGTTPFIYQVEQFVRWGYGPVAGLLALAGIVLLAVMAIRGTNPGAMVLVSWVAAYGAVLLVADVKFLRYLEPLSPVFAVGAALAFISLRDALRPRWPMLARAAAPVAMGLVMAWSGAFASIYAHENSRLAATKWLYATIPAGSALTSEYWDDALPRALSYTLSPAAFGYASIILDLYRDLPPEEASNNIFQGIDRADYIIQSSERVEAATAAAPWRYPVQGRYFDQLERGKLGFSRTATFARGPSLPGLEIDDSTADESFVNYDHPHVTVYKKQDQALSRSRFDDAMSWALQRLWFPARELPQPTLLLDQPVGENPSVNDGRWSAAATSSTPIAIAAWLVLLLALVTAGLPLARLVCGTFPDAGWGLARPLAFIAAAYPVWLGASLQLIRFRSLWVIVALAVLAIAGWRSWLRHRAQGSTVSAVPPGRFWVHAEAAFWLVFIVFLAFRLINPDGWHPLWGGEKPMEFALINAIERSAYFPPYDPWYADGYVNYYYYGFYLVAFLFKATGIPAEIGFNLALPTFMALLGGAGFSVGAALSGSLTRSRRLGVAGGWIATGALCLMGNLSAVSGLLSAGSDRVDPFLAWTWNGSRAIDFVITEFPFFSGLYGDLHAHVVALPLTVVVIGLSLALATSANTPADARAPSHRSAIARVALLALTLGSLWATNAWDVPVYTVLAVAAALMAATVGAPLTQRAPRFLVTALAIAGGAWLLFLPFHRHFVPLFSQLALVRDPTDLMQFLSHFGGLLVVAAFGLTVLILDRLDRSVDAQFGNAWPIVPLIGLAAGVAARTISDGPGGQLAGALLIGASLASPPLLALWLRATDAASGASWVRRGVRVLTLLGALGGFASVVAGRDVLGLLFPLALAAAAGWLICTRSAERFVCLLLAAALFTAGGAEIVVIADDLVGSDWYRMNTVFKFYNQVWVLLGLAGSALVALMVHEAFFSGSSTREHQSPRSARFTWSRVGVALSCAVLLASLTYPLLATPPRLTQRFDAKPPLGTLNALDWMQSGVLPAVGPGSSEQIAYRGDAAAISWLFEHVEGTPVIAEASIGPYRCNGSRVANATGLPTIIGWERHEQQQRYPETLPARVNDVRTLFTSSDPAEKASILDRYNVEYIVVGDLERLYPLANNECAPTGTPDGARGFDTMVGDRLEVVHSAYGTTIYRVLPVGSE